MLTTCPDADDAWSRAHAAGAADVAGNAPLDRARAVTPSGTPRCKNAGTTAPPPRERGHSSPADRTSVRKILGRAKLGAGPRASPARQLTLPLAHAHAHVAAADNAALAHADAPDPAAWPASADLPDNAATAALPGDTSCCKSGSADGTADTNLHSPSAGNAAAGLDNRLVSDQTMEDTEVGPRERELPEVKPRRGASHSSPGRSY